LSAGCFVEFGQIFEVGGGFFGIGTQDFQAAAGRLNGYARIGGLRGGRRFFRPPAGAAGR